MSITFENEANIILWSLAKLLVTFEERQYHFAAQCIWWIAALVQLDPALRYFIDHRELPSKVMGVDAETQSTEMLISPTPRDLQRHSETDEYAVPERSQYQADPLRHTWKGRSNSLPQTKKQLKAGRKRQSRNQQRKKELVKNLCGANIV